MNEAELLFTEVLNCDRASLYNKSLKLNKEKCAFIASVLKRRMRKEPLQYILGEVEFMGLAFKVNPSVLIPRPETELLVESVVFQVSSFKLQASGVKILDIGTGSGCIAVSLAKFLPQTQITALDISPAALEVAMENARLHNVEDRITFFQSDLFMGYDPRAMAYDIIVSNPPYVAERDKLTLQPELFYEPEVALFAGDDGLDFFRKLSVEVPKYLKPNGLLITEIGFGQRKQVEKIFKSSNFLRIIEIVKDYNNINRVIIFKRNNG